MRALNAFAMILSGIVIGLGLALAAAREANAADGWLSCADARRAQASASADVPTDYLAAAVRGVCNSRGPVQVVTVSRSFMDEAYGHFAGLTMPVGYGEVRQSAHVIFLTSRGDYWRLLSHELAHVGGWRHAVPATAADAP